MNKKTKFHTENLFEKVKHNESKTHLFIIKLFSGVAYLEILIDLNWNEFINASFQFTFLAATSRNLNGNALF